VRVRLRLRLRLRLRVRVRGWRVGHRHRAWPEQARAGAQAASRQDAKADDQVSVLEQQVQRVRRAGQHLVRVRVRVRVSLTLTLTRDTNPNLTLT